MSSRNGAVSAFRIFLALILIAVVVVLETSFQTVQLLDDRAKLDRIKAGQDDAVSKTVSHKDDLENVVTGTLNLARDGDKNVLPIIEQLKKLGLVKETPRQ